MSNHTREELAKRSMHGKGGLRDLARGVPALRGAFANGASRELLEAVLAGEISPDVAVGRYAQSLTEQSGHPEAATVVAETLTAPEPPTGDTVVVGSPEQVLASAKSVFGGESQFVKAFEGTLKGLKAVREDFSVIVTERDSTREALRLANAMREDVEAELVEVKKKAQAAAPIVLPQPTLAADGGQEVELCGVKVPVFSNSDPLLVPKTDPHFDFVNWKSKLQAGTPLEYGTKEVLSALMADERVMLVGPPGCGKTTWAEQVAALMKMPCFRVNLSDHMTDDSFVGTWVAANGSTTFVHGVLPRAMQTKPGALVILDELDHASASCTSVLHSVLEPGGKLVIPANFGEVVVPGDQLRFLATCNTQGLGDVSGAHTNAKVQDAALLSRWTCTFHVGWMDPVHEVAMLARRTGVDNMKGGLVVAVANDVRKAFEAQEVSAPMTLRQTPAWCRRAIGWGGDAQAWALAFGAVVLAKLPVEERAAVSAIAQRHWGENIKLA